MMKILKEISKTKPMKISDKILLWLIYRRWGKLEKKIDGKTFTTQDYSKRRKPYEDLMWEIRKNDL